MKQLTLTLLIGGALLAGGAILAARLSGDGAAQTIPDEALFAVRRGTLTCTITENGSLMAKNSEKVSSQAERGGKISFLIDEGKTGEYYEYAYARLFGRGALRFGIVDVHDCTVIEIDNVEDLARAEALVAARGGR